MTDSPFRVLLIGRTNVGKTTFFSRMSEMAAVISPEKHTTRDAREAVVRWNKKSFLLIDTGGFDIAHTDPYGKEVSDTIESELTRANIIILMTDMLDPLPHDEERWLKRLSKEATPILIAVNKQDRPAARRDLHERSVKNIPVFALSSTNGGGTGDLLDAIVERMPNNTSIAPTRTIRLGLIGRTNVGKSSLLNVFAGEPKAIVSDAHHTTREPISVVVPFRDVSIEVIDTAGAQKRPKKDVARKAVELTKKTIASCDVIAVVIEYGMNPIPSQDLELASFAIEKRKSLCIIINKWDLARERTHREAQKEIKRVARAFSHFDFAPILVASATKQIHTQDILKKVYAIYHERFVELEAKDMRQIVATLAEHIFHLTQTEVDPPRFHAIATSRMIPRAMTDILEKRIRSTHAFIGTPIIVSLAKRSRRNESRSRAR